MSGDIEIILASRSLRRKRLLEKAGVPFIAHQVDVAEIEYPGLPDQTAAANSEMKAAAAARLCPERVILAADTVVFLGMLLGKPAGLEDARRMLALLSGRTHSVHTAVTVLAPFREQSATRVAVSRVTMRDYGRETIEEYLRRADPLDKAGAYGIQEHGDLLVRNVEGSLSNVIGLPLELLAELFGFFQETKDLSDRLKTAAVAQAARLCRIGMTARCSAQAGGLCHQFQGR